MKGNMETHTTVFVPIKDGTTRLDADPESKKKRFQKLTDGPARKVGCVLLLIIVMVTILYSRSKLESEFGSFTNDLPASSNASALSDSGLITHDWSGVIYRDTTKPSRYTSDPITAVLEVRNPYYPTEVVRLDGSGKIPPEWKQLQFRLADNEQITSAKLIIR